MQNKQRDARRILFEAGESLMSESSFKSVSVTQIMCKAKMPKGSFYYYFESKEQFGVELLKNYIERYREEVSSLLLLENQPGTKAYDRLIQLHRNYYENHRKNDWKIPCLFMKIASEVSDMSEKMRAVIEEGVRKITDLHVKAVEEGIRDGSIHPCEGLSMDSLGEMIFVQWKGAVLISDLYRNSEAPDNFFLFLRAVCGN